MSAYVYNIFRDEYIYVPVAAPSTTVLAAGDPDGPLVPLPVRVRTPHRYELLGYTPNKWGEH